MSLQPKPRKPRRKGSKKIVLNNYKRWKDIVNDVDKRQVPVNILQAIEVRLIDGTRIDIDIKKLLGNGIEEADIENLLDEKFVELDQYIENVDFFVDVNKVEATIQPETDKVLKGL
jgi:hypothetical protein